MTALEIYNALRDRNPTISSVVVSDEYCYVADKQTYSVLVFYKNLNGEQENISFREDSLIAAALTAQKYF